MKTLSTLMVMRAQTSLHAGTGQATGAIDLPVQREGHTHWPCIYGSSLKGAVRMSYCSAGDEIDDLLDPVEVFGPEPAKAGDNGHAGALSVSDARLLLLPVRSLTSHFRWVCCPAILDRLIADCKRLGIQTKVTGLVSPMVAGNDALAALGAGEALFLEDYRFETKALVGDWAQELVRLIAPGEGDEARKRLEQQIVVIGNDAFAHLSSFSLPVYPHVCLNSENKTVKEGPWFEECLPPESVLYAMLTASNSRGKQVAEATDVLAAITDRAFADRPYLQVGANETVGMGWCELNFVAERAA